MRYKTLVETRTREWEQTRCENANDLIFFGGIPEWVEFVLASWPTGRQPANSSQLSRAAFHPTVNSFENRKGPISQKAFNTQNYGKQSEGKFYFGIFPLFFLFFIPIIITRA